MRTDTEHPQLLLHMHKKLGVLLQPGGHVELNENQWQAICHEVDEETGYDMSQLQLLQPRERLRGLTDAQLHPIAVCQSTHDFDGDSSHRHTDTAYAFVTAQDPKGSPSDGESTDLRWLTVHELDQLSSDEIFEDVREIGRFVLMTCLEYWEKVALDSYER